MKNGDIYKLINICLKLAEEADVESVREYYKDQDDFLRDILPYDDIIEFFRQ